MVFINARFGQNVALQKCEVTFVSFQEIGLCNIYSCMLKLYGALYLKGNIS
jgi:hypothetical protein